MARYRFMYNAYRERKTFLLEKTPVQKDIGLQESKQEDAKVVPLCTNGGISKKCIQSLPSKHSL